MNLLAPRRRAALALLALALLVPAPSRAQGAPAAAPDDAALRAALDAIAASPALRAARTSILVSSVEDGRVVYAHDADVLLNPASNVKLFTAAAALGRLGPEFRFETEFWLDARPDGRPRTLFVRGKGDPTLVTERLFVIAGELRRHGLASVREIVIDDAWFDGERQGPGYDQEDGDRSYLAPTGAVSLNFNAVAIHLAPGKRARERVRVDVQPESDFVTVENRAVTVKAGGRRKVKVTSTFSGGRQHVRVEGTLPLGGREQTLYRKIDDPPAYFGATLAAVLEMRGVKVTGPVRLGPVPASAHLLHVSESESLGDIARRLNKSSNNFIAEQLVKALGAQVKGTPGTWPKGIAAVEEFLEGAGIPRGAYVMKNGSGLNDANRFSARQTVTLLTHMWRRFPLMAEFLASLPVAGRDGTIRWRMDGSQAQGMLRAKTGTLENVTSLSGFVETASRERLAFAILVNDFPRRRGVIRAVDALGGAIASAGHPAQLEQAVADATPPPPGPEAPPDALAGQLATYYRLGSAGDARNLTFLRTALRAEQDPVLRMAAAEAIYRSDPDGDSARRAFLENVTIDAGAFARLRGASNGAPGATPVLGSLAELAVDGNLEALARMIELAPVATAEPGLATAYEEALADVSSGAPEELVAALRAGDGPARDAAIAALAKARARATEPDRALDAALQSSAADSDAGVAAFARTLQARLDDEVAAARAAAKTPAKDAIGPATVPARP